MLVSLASAPTALAQAGAGTRANPYAPGEVPISKNISEIDRSRITMSNYATCVVKFRPSDVIAFLKLFPNSKASVQAGKELAFGDCLAAGKLSTNSRLLRGSLFAALYRKNFGRRAAPIPDQAIDFDSDTAGQEPERASEYKFIREFGDCVVRSDPASSRALVMAKTASEDESAALTQLASYLEPCLTEGTQIKFSKSILSGLIAEILYRLSVLGTETSAISGAK